MARAEVTGRKPLVTAADGDDERKPPKANSLIVEPDPDAIEATHQHGPDGHTTSSTPPIRGPPKARSAHNRELRRQAAVTSCPPAAYTIAQFCAVHQMSESMYFKMREAGLGPQEIQLGRRRIISLEAAARWRAEREAAAAAAE
jgi:hypothetical protein